MVTVERIQIITHVTYRKVCLALLCTNFQVTQLKIDNNPFAKGFRDTGNGRREKRLFFYYIIMSAKTGFALYCLSVSIVLSDLNAAVSP